MRTVTIDPQAHARDTASDTALDNPVWHSLVGPHAHLAEGADVGAGLARRYRSDISVFGALADPQDPQAWADLAALVGPGGEVLITGDDVPAPAGWSVGGGTGVQMLATDRVEADLDPELVVLGSADVDDMVDLVSRTKPGPFRSGTPLMGTYLGLRREGRLIALAGERMHPEGWTEISAVATDPDHRRQGLAARLVRSVVAGVRARGERAFLHAASENLGAIRVYRALGFEERRVMTFRGVRAPQG
ncbi:GNAT family N-acetyltransferase [Nocardioides sp. DS6]|uniref:GNAT family N-acetyltransferase n=1 Tax=Nocardioides eburneus TaxID=3231482 RepID=A0ABV3SZL2_9ACTN